jgi:hypothetical protein
MKNRYFLIYYKVTKYYESMINFTDTIRKNVLIETKGNFPSKKQILEKIEKDEYFGTLKNLIIMNIFEFKCEQDYKDYIGA